jgi:hypothetical protein
VSSWLSTVASGYSLIYVHGSVCSCTLNTEVDMFLDDLDGYTGRKEGLILMINVVEGFGRGTSTPGLPRRRLRVLLCVTLF